MSFNTNVFTDSSSTLGLGYNGVKVTLNYFDGLPILQNVQSTDLQLCFKSLLKRANTTKEKALNDLLSFIQDDDKLSIFQDDMFILSWCQIYAKLISSDSKTIRIQAHQFTATLIAKFGKRVSKFLKELIPMLLSGLFDVDTAVGRSCSDSLLNCFKDSNKVNSLWKLFTSEILNFIKQVIIVETAKSISDERYYTKEDISLRYNQLLIASIRTLTKLISVEELTTDQMETLHEILTDEEFWNNLSLKDTKNLKGYQSLLHLMIELRSRQLYRKNKEALKLASKKLLVSLSQCNAKTLISVSSVLPDILKTLLEMNKYKDGKFWSYEKKSKERLLTFLSLGPGISDPVYYSLAYQLSAESSILEHQEWLSIWIKYLDHENDRRVLGRNGYKSLIEAWKNCIKFSISSSDQDSIQQLHPNILRLITTKDLKEIPELVLELSPTRINYAFLYDLIIDLLPLGKGEKRKEVLLISNTCLILSSDITTMHMLSVEVMKSLEELENPDDLPSCYGFIFYDNLIKTNNLNLTKEVNTFIDVLPTLVSEAFFKIPMDVMIDFSNSAFLANSTWEQYFDDFIMVLSQYETPKKAIPSFLARLNSEFLSKLMHSSQSYKDFTEDFVSTYQFDDDSIFKSKILNGSLLLRLYEASKKQGHVKAFKDYCTEIPETSEAYITLLSNSDFLSQSLIVDQKVTIPTTAHSDQTIANAVFKTVLDTISVECLITEDSIDEFVLQLQQESLLTRLFISLDLEVMFSRYINKIDTRTSVTSPLGLLPHILTAKGDASLVDYLKLIRLSQVVDKILTRFPDEVSTSHLLFLTRCYELTADYNCLSDEQITYFHENNIFSSCVNVSFEDLISSFTEDQSNEILTVLFDKNSSEVTSFYNCKIIYRICLNSVDYLSISQFDKIMDGFLRTARSLLSSKALLVPRTLYMYAIFAASFKFNTVSANLCVFRNYLLSELVGVRWLSASETQKCFVSMLFLSQMLDFNVDTFNSSPLDDRRLNMALVSVTTLMQSEVWYDNSSNDVRLVIIQFLVKLHNLREVLDASERLLDCSVQLLQDCLGFLELREFQYYDELRYYVFVLINCIQNPTAFSDEVDLATVIDVAFSNSDLETAVSTAYSKPLSVFLGALPYKEKSGIFDRLLNEYFNPQTALVIMNVLLPELKAIIKEHQQEMVIEYELLKATITPASATEPSPSLGLDFEIPPTLLQSLDESMPHDYLEYQDKKTFMKYLNYCHLLVFYFEDISYDLRQRYIQQLKGKDLINRLLDFLADQMTLSYTKYWDNIDIQNVLSYPYSSNRGKLDPVDECNMMMEFLMYHFFTIFGSLVGHWWNAIKSRTFKDTVSTFVTRYISPTLITNELDETDKGLNKFNKDELNLTVKVNRNNNEIKASYLIDEQKLVVAFKLPSNFPLQNVQVHGVSRVGITEQQWKSWIISTQRIISNMNGSVVDSLELLSKNVKLQFSGFEECAICYYVLHAIDRKLPTKVCPTCNNRFHGACLYKWFKSSGNNTCPLCRGEFNLRK